MSGDSFDPDHVAEVVAHLAGLIEKDRQSAPSEAQTIAKYVLPLLRALGWSFEDDRIIMEYSVKGKAVDLALVTEQKAVAFIEAKRLRQNLSLKDEEAAQALNYGYQSGINWCVLTNGERYEVYDAFAKVDHARKLVVALSILEAAADPASLSRFRLLSYEGFTSGELVRFAKHSFSLARVREALAAPSTTLMNALCKELESCDLTEADVRLGLGQLLSSALVDPAPPPSSPTIAKPVAEERKVAAPGRQPKYAADEWGPQAYQGPLRIDGDALSVTKRRTFKGDHAEKRVSRGSLSKVAQTVSALAADANVFTVSAVNDAQEPANRVSYNTVNRCLGVLFVAGLLECSLAGGNQHYSLREALSPEQIVQRVLSRAKPA